MRFYICQSIIKVISVDVVYENCDSIDSLICIPVRHNCATASKNQVGFDLDRLRVLI
jgi:hypothetical protein